MVLKINAGEIFANLNSMKNLQRFDILSLSLNKKMSKIDCNIYVQTYL